MDILEFTRDPEKSTKGIKVSLGGDAYIVVAEMDTPEFWESYRKNRECLIEGDRVLSADEEQKVYVDTLVDCVLLGWENLTEAGQPVEYSPKKAAEWLSDPNKSRFLDKVVTEGRKFANFKAEKLQAEKKP